MAYDRKRRELKTAIKMAKRKCWRDLCEEADSDPWGRPYKSVMNKIKPRGPNAPTCPVFLDRIVCYLFPVHQERTAGTGLTVIDGVAKSPGATKAEVKMAAKKISIRKAPGLDGIPGLAIKTSALNVPHIFVDTFNACLQEGIFPAQWKAVWLVLLAKGKKPAQEPSPYRPLSMLDIVGKLFGRILSTRLHAAILEAGGLSDNQFGFRKGRSTIDAIGRVKAVASDAIFGSRCTKRMCAVIGLDIRNAFNSARWDYIMESLERLKVSTSVGLSQATWETEPCSTTPMMACTPTKSPEVCRKVQSLGPLAGTSYMTDYLENRSQRGPQWWLSLTTLCSSS